MPVKFDKCRKAGGRIRTLKPKGKDSKVYKKVCFPKGGGSSVAGHTKRRKGKR